MTKQTFDKLVNEDIKRLIQQGEIQAVQVCNGGDWPESFEDWLKSNNDDIGGNWTPDRVQANHQRYDQQGEERPF